MAVVLYRHSGFEYNSTFKSCTCKNVFVALFEDCERCFRKYIIAITEDNIGALLNSLKKHQFLRIAYEYDIFLQLCFYNEINKLRTTLELEPETYLAGIVDLLQYGIDVNLLMQKYPYCIVYCRYSNRVIAADVFGKLLDYGLDINTEYMSAPLIFYIIDANDDQLILLLDTLISSISTPITSNRRSIGKTKNQLANILAIKNIFGQSILTHSVNKPIDVIRRLLALGADINDKGWDGDTILHRAVARDIKNLVEYLLSEGADPHIKNNDEQSAYDAMTNDMKEYADSMDITKPAFLF